MVSDGLGRFGIARSVGLTGFEHDTLRAIFQLQANACKSISSVCRVPLTACWDGTRRDDPVLGRTPTVPSVGRDLHGARGVREFASKFAVEALSDSLHSEISDYDIDVVVLESGPVETEFGSRAFEKIPELDRIGAYEWFYRIYDDRKFIDRGVREVQPEGIPEIVLEIASAENPDRQYTIGSGRYRLLAGTVP